jgi:hypothetical protein
MAYTADKPPLPETSEQLRARIPGWGADLDPATRPAVPREIPAETGAHWDFPERQVEESPRERSIEHAFLTPVFGTSAPLKGLSGALRRLAYARYSEGRAAHWLILVAADRVDVAESRVTSLLKGHPDRMIAELGLRGERSGRGLSARRGQGRADVNHQWMDPFVVAAPWLAVAGLGYRAYRVLRRRASRVTATEQG